MARIEVREFILGSQLGINVAIHQFLVKYNDNGSKEELHGVAIDPATCQFDPVAVANGRVLKVAAHPPIPSHELLTIQGFNSLYEAGQNNKTLLEGAQDAIDARWNAAIKASELINVADDWKYELKGGGHNDSTSGNSNSIAATLENIMGFTADKINRGFAAPGLEKNVLPQAEYGDLYTAEWGVWSAYEPDSLDIMGKDLAAVATNVVTIALSVSYSS